MSLILIVITGLPATGKTTLGRTLANELDLPFICKDEIKEILFDNLGFKDVEWSKKVGGLSYDLLYYMTESLLKAGKSLIIEANFDSKYANPKLNKLKAKYGFLPFQIRCITDGDILLDRFIKRADSNDRHSGHVDNNILIELKPILSTGKIQPLDIGGELVDVDTSDFNKIDYTKLMNKINSIFY